MSFEYVDYSVEDGVAVISLNRPDKRNAISVQVAHELSMCFARFTAGEERAAVLASNDHRLFSAGADLFDPPAEAWKAIPELGFRTDKPIVAAVNGRAIGLALILASMCDFLVVSDETLLHYPEAQLGFSIGAISALANRMPIKVAMELMMLGEPISGSRAFELGFANRLVEAGRERAEAIKMGTQLAANAPLVVQGLKRMSLDVLGQSPIQTHFAVHQYGCQMMDSEDAQRGLEAFRTKTKAVFVGR